MLPSIMTARDDAAPDGGSKLRLVTTGSGHSPQKRPSEPGPTDDDGPGNGLASNNGAGARILSRARAGDPEAFRAIFQRYGRPVLAFIYHIVGDRSRAEELTQETFLRAHRSFGQMPEGIKLSTWLFGIARNVSREAIRDQRRRRREVGFDEIVFSAIQDEKAGPDENFMSEELQRIVRRAVGELSEDQRVVFVLKLFSKMRYEEISVITGSSIGKLKTDLHRARQQMRGRLQSYIEVRTPAKRGES